MYNDGVADVGSSRGNMGEFCGYDVDVHTKLWRKGGHTKQYSTQTIAKEIYYVPEYDEQTRNTKQLQRVGPKEKL